ncbi:MAG: IS1634 family transposase, partial [Methanotrichaceae archaeon]|nr:IS1634 family transposase [Methanotrichaceae archaeon]
FPSDQSLMRLAGCIMININEEWVTGKRYSTMDESNDSRIQGRYEITADSGHYHHGEDLPQKGNSKEKRFDKNLIGVGLTTSDHNIPFQSITYPANKNDAKLFSNLIDSICERLKNINIQTHDLVIVFDRGMNSAENIKKAVERMHIVGSLPSSMCKEAFNIPISEFHEKWENASGNTIMVYPVTGNWYETKFRGVIKYSEATRAKQLNDWASNKSKILTKVEEIKSKLERSGKGRKITAKGLINRIVDAIPKQYRGLFDYRIIETDGKLELVFKLDEVRETEHILAMGKTVIFTDQKDSTLREIVETYDARNQIENDIAWLKDKLLIPLKPVYVRKDSQIRAHVFLCVTGLLLYNYMLYVIQDSSLSIKQLAEHLDQMRLGLVRDNDGKGKGK